MRDDALFPVSASIAAVYPPKIVTFHRQRDHATAPYRAPCHRAVPRAVPGRRNVAQCRRPDADRLGTPAAAAGPTHRDLFPFEGLDRGGRPVLKPRSPDGIATTAAVCHRPAGVRDTRRVLQESARPGEHTTERKMIKRRIVTDLDNRKTQF